MPRPRTVDLRWKAIVNDFRRSGLTQAEFCRRRELPLHSFRKHLYRPRPPLPLPADQLPAAADHLFLPVTILPDAHPSLPVCGSHHEQIHPTGHRIAVPPGFDPRTLRHLIAVLEGRPCSDWAPRSGCTSPRDRPT